MQKITFHNNQNSLEYTFAADTPRALLVEFDGNSLSAEHAQFKPVGFDGSRTYNHTLNARTITFTAAWYAVEGGKRSREKALAEWDKMLAAFAPGQSGTLTWTNGVKTRTIECYTNEVPELCEKARGLFSAEFELTADNPLWLGEEHSFTLADELNIEQVFTVNASAVVAPIIDIYGGDLTTVDFRIRNNHYEYCKVYSLPEPPSYYPNFRLDLERGIACYFDNYGTEDNWTKYVALAQGQQDFVLYPGEAVAMLYRNDGFLSNINIRWYDKYWGVGK